MAKPFNENICRGLIALAESDIQNELAVPFNCDERVGVAKALIFVRTNPFLLLADKSPKFVAFHVAHYNVADLVCHDALTLFTGKDQQLENRRVMDACYSLDTRNGISFEHHAEHKLGLIDGRVHTVQVILAKLQESLRALLALEPLVTLAVFTVLLSPSPAIVANHLWISS